MSKSVESIVRHMISHNNHNINIAFPAVVVNIDELKDGFIDVRPLVNYMNPLTHETVELPVLHQISVVFPSTRKSTICFPVNQGDFVELIVQSVDTRSFSEGEEEQHDPDFLSFGDVSNVVAIVGFTPFQHSCFNPSNYKQDFDNQNLNIVHNKNTESEVSITLKEDGEITLKSPVKVVVEASEVGILSNSIDANNATIKTSGDVLIKGKSVFGFMNAHTHTGNQGVPTSSPLPI